MSVQFYFEEPINRQLTCTFTESSQFRALNYGDQNQILSNAGHIIKKSGFRQIQKLVVDLMLQMVGLRKPYDVNGPDQIITEVHLTQEDVRFVTANSFTPLNKLSQIVVTPSVLVLFSDQLKSQLEAKPLAQGQSPESLRCAESKDPVYENLVSQLMQSVVSEMVALHRVKPPPVLSLNDRFNRH